MGAGILLIVTAGILTARSPSRKTAAFKAVLFVGSLAVACLVAEAALRIVAARDHRRGVAAWGGLNESPMPVAGSNVLLPQLIRLSDDPELAYELKPGLDVQFMGGRVRTTREGFRITPGSRAENHAFTIVGLGDSVMFGWGVDDDETYLAGLLDRLDARLPDAPTRIVNLAVPGYNTYLELQAFKRHGVSRGADLVLIHLANGIVADALLAFLIEQGWN